MKRDFKVYINDVLESIEKIEDYIKGVSESEFKKNLQLQDAILRRLEVIGEAVKNIPQSFRNKYPKIPWKEIAGMRDVLIHGYFGVNIERIWKVAKEDILHLKNNLLKINIK
ncbi:MAG: DUF86 domain-containing protein [Nanoarchaeota archaeon]|nr:DUF86 domain-containing protein [Nanoarchaeota archaeon]